jgi:hypothetical protein
MLWNREWLIFMIGMIPFFAAYWPLKAVLEPIWFVAAAALYLIVLRILVTKLMKKINRSHKPDPPNG